MSVAPTAGGGNLRGMDRHTFLRLISVLTGGAALGTFPEPVEAEPESIDGGGHEYPPVGVDVIRFYWHDGDRWREIMVDGVHVSQDRETVETVGLRGGPRESGVIEHLPALTRTSVTCDLARGVHQQFPDADTGQFRWRMGSDRMGWYHFPGHVTSVREDRGLWGSASITISPDGWIERELPSA